MTIRKFPFLACCLALSASFMLHQLHSDSQALDKLRLEARAGDIDSIRELANSTVFLWPYERCAYQLWLARHDVSELIPIEAIPYCVKAILPDGHYIVKQYYETLPGPF